MPRQTRQGTDRAKLTTQHAEMVYDAARNLAGTPMTSVGNEHGKRPET